MAVKRRVQRELRFNVWTGTAADIERIVSVVEDKFEPERAAARAAAEASVADVTPEVHGEAYAARRHREVRQRVDDEWVMTARVEDRSLRQDVVGPLDDALGEVATRDVNSIRITYPSNRVLSSQPHVDLSWRKSAVPGLSVTIVGDDVSWAEGVAGTLRLEGARGVPKWSCVVRPFAQAALGIVAFLAVAFLGFAIADFHQSLWEWVTILAVALAVQWSVAGPWFYRALFPPFELLDPGQTRAGDRHLAWVGTLLAGAVVAVVVALVV